MRFLLVGGIGYLGGRLAQYLKARSQEVFVTTRRPVSETPAWLSADRVFQADLNSESDLATFPSGIDVVIYLAAPDNEAARQEPASTLRFGAETTWRVMAQLAGLAKPPAVIYMSTYHVYGRNLRGTVTEDTPVAPVHPYALSKYFAEEVVRVFRRQAGVKGLCVRLSNGFGAPAGLEVSQWSLLFNDLCRQAVTKGKLVLKSSGIQKRNFITLADAARALEHLAAHQDLWPADGVINLGSSICVSIREAAEIVAGRAQSVLGFRPGISARPPAPGETPGELLFSTDRLARTGFGWTNGIDAEVDATLRLCSTAFGGPGDLRLGGGSA
jgi:UDP-glucose 4-epimerase